MSLTGKLFILLFPIYFILVFIQLLIGYKIFKEEKEVSGFFDFIGKLNHLNVKLYPILFGKTKVSDSRKLNILRINTFALFSILLFIFYLFFKG